MTALTLYTQDAALRESGAELPSRREYYTALRDALHNELSRDGYSPLLEEIFIAMRQKTITRIYTLDYAALTACYSLIVSNQPLPDACEHIPYLLKSGQKVGWDTLDLPGPHTLRITEEMLRQVRLLRTVSRQVASARGEGFADAEEGASRKEFEQLQSVARILNERCKSLEQEREALRKRIADLEDGLVDQQTAQLIQQRFEQAEQEMQAEYARRRQEAAKAYREQYRKEQARHAARLEQEAAEAAALTAQAQQAYAGIRRSLAEETARLEALLSAQAAKWQSALDRTEYRMLAASYTALHALLTDGLDGAVLEAACAGDQAHPALVALQGQARDRLRQLEQAMQRLGLAILRPEAGDAFDPVRHIPVGVAAGSQEGRCFAFGVRPGVALMGEGETLIPAEVALK